MRLELREFIQDNDYKNQRDLFELSFPENLNSPICTKEHYDWKFNSFPGVPHSYQYVSYENSQMLGYYAAIPYQYRVNGVNVICGMVCDVMTHPQARGRGVFTKIGSYATADLSSKGIGFTTGYPIRPEVIPGHLKVGWKKILKLPMYIKVIRTKTLMPKKLRIISSIIDPIIWVVANIPYFWHKKYNVEVHDRSILDTGREEIELFLSEWVAEQKNALVKSCDFLKWRLNAPGTDYFISIIRAVNSNEIIGIAISRPTILKGVSVLAILDIMIQQKHYTSSTALFKSLTLLASNIKKDALVCMTSKKWSKNYHFTRSFFLKTPAVFTLIIKKLAPTISDEALFDEESWHLFWIDSDDL